MGRINRLPQGVGVSAVDVRTRALAIWPGLDRRKLARACGDPARIARLVERRTSLRRESIIGILEGRSQVDAPDSDGPIGRHPGQPA